MSFRFQGVIPASKSILNRLLILKSFAPALEIKMGESSADDVLKMRSAILSLLNGEPADCGAAGTTLRFLAMRASRIPGRHRLTGSPRLLERPQAEIKNVLSQLGCHVELTREALIISGDDWKIPQDGLRVDRSISSQFASALVLSAWDLPSPLKMLFEGDTVSEGYLKMTLEIVKKAGMSWQRESASQLILPPHARIVAKTLEAECDLSSAFAIAALAAVRGSAEFNGWPDKSLQPDSIFPEILKRMGASVSQVDGTMKIESGSQLLAIEQDLRDAPDLFPVLSVLCALAKGKSILRGAPHLAHKESSRIEKSAQLVRQMGAEVEVGSDGMKIEGGGLNAHTFTYDPEHDHRLAMAAAVARHAGCKIEILNPSVVDKSFPEFWDIVRKGKL